MVKINFERGTKYGAYRDAITLPDDHGLTQAQLDALMQQRVDNWVSTIENPPPAPIEDSEYIEIDGVKYLRVE